jgi:outer membrane protein OmpA-like peptidoglycan-associated protein
MAPPAEQEAFMYSKLRIIGAALPLVATLLSHPCQAATASEPATPPAAVPDSISVYFATGSTAIRQADLDKLDFAARLYREAKPIVMQVAGSADATGSPEANLRLSQSRADAVFRGLVARGIPAERFQILAKGVTDLPVADKAGVPDERNRRVQITWR